MPRYVDNTLLKDEKLIYFSRPHWIIYMPGVFAFIVALIFVYFGPKYFNLRLDIWGSHTLYGICATISAIIGICWLLSAYVKYQTSEYAITDRRVIMKTGWIQRNSLELFLRKLEAININQTITGRLLNYGTVTIVGTGGTEDHYFNVRDPLRFRKVVQQQADLLIDNEDKH